MSKLNNSSIRDIRDQLSNSSFPLDDFRIVLSEPESETLFEIYYLPIPEYKLLVFGDDGVSPPTSLDTVEVPGECMNEENYGSLDIPSAIARIYHWCDSIRDELEAAAQAQEMRDGVDLSDQIEDMVTHHIPDPDELFKAAEIAEIRSRLKTIESRFEEMERNGEITKEHLSDLTSRVDLASGNLDTMKKGAWYRTSLSRIGSALRTIIGSKEGREIAKDAIKRLIGLD